MLLRYVLRRLVILIPTLLVSSILIFTVMELPPGNYFETYSAELQAQGEKADVSRMEFLKREYGFDKGPVQRYLLWIKGIAQGDFGYSFEYQMPVRDVVGGRVWFTMLLSSATMLVTWIVA